MSSERAWCVCALAGMRRGIGRAATMLEARVEAAMKRVENCILIVWRCWVGLVWFGRVEVVVSVVMKRVDVVVKSVSWKLKGVL